MRTQKSVTRLGDRPASWGLAIGRDSALLGLGASSALSATTALRVDYDATLNNDRAEQAVSLALHVTW